MKTNYFFKNALLAAAMLVAGGAGAQTFTPATSVAVGDTIIIVNLENKVAMANNAGNYRSQTAITVGDDGNIELTSTSTIAQIVLEASSTTGEYMLHVITGDTGYLTGHASKNYMSTGENAAGSWSVTFGAGEDAVEIVDNSVSGSNILKYNLQATRFSCYKSDSSIKTLVSIFKKVAGSKAEEGQIETLTIAQAIAAATGTPCQLTGTVLAEYSRGYILGDGTANILVYYGNDYDPATIAVGDSVNVTGTTGTYNNGPQLGSATTTVISSGNAVNHGTPTEITAANSANMLSEDPVEVRFVTVTGTLSVSSNYYNIAIDGTTTEVASVSFPMDDLGLSAYKDKEVTVNGYFFSTSTSKYLNIMATSLGEATALHTPSMPNGLSFDGRVIRNEQALPLTVYTVSGLQVAADNGNIDMTRMPKGIYLVRTQNATLKIVKQ